MKIINKLNSGYCSSFSRIYKTLDQVSETSSSSAERTKASTIKSLKKLVSVCEVQPEKNSIGKINKILRSMIGADFDEKYSYDTRYSVAKYLHENGIELFPEGKFKYRIEKEHPDYYMKDYFECNKDEEGTAFTGEYLQNNVLLKFLEKFKEDFDPSAVRNQHKSDRLQRQIVERLAQANEEITQWDDLIKKALKTERVLESYPLMKNGVTTKMSDWVFQHCKYEEHSIDLPIEKK